MAATAKNSGADGAVCRLQACEAAVAALCERRKMTTVIDRRYKRRNIRLMERDCVRSTSRSSRKRKSVVESEILW